jgi:hypothetical protein
VAGCVRACAFVAVRVFIGAHDSITLLQRLFSTTMVAGLFFLSEYIYVNDNDSSATTASRLLWQCAIPPVRSICIFINCLVCFITLLCHVYAIFNSFWTRDVNGEFPTGL